MAKVKVVSESSKAAPYVQIYIPLREAKLLISEHKNTATVLLDDIKKAVVYAEKLTKR